MKTTCLKPKQKQSHIEKSLRKKNYEKNSNYDVPKV